jgi:superfamily I DNA/RNA helicase
MEKVIYYGPPGTGKTTKLVDIAKELLSQGVQPQKIAYVSFTRKAADEARDRARKELNLPKGSFVNFRTCHSLAYRELGLSPSDVMQDSHWDEVNDLCGIKLSPTKHSEGLTADNIVSFHLHLAKVKCMTPTQHFRDVAGSLNDRKFNFGMMSRGGSLEEFDRLSNFLDEYKAKKVLFDFNDMLSKACHCEPLDVEYAFIDEAQDLSRLQWRFCKNIFRNCKKVFIAGDDDQAIYSWAGADLYTFRNMEAERTVLGRSWRISKPIFKLANGIIQRVQDRYPKDWEPREGDDGLLEWVSGLSDCPLESGSWMLLTRTKSQQQGLVHWLRGHGYTYMRNQRHSVRGDHISLAKSWTRLGKGKYITVAQALAIYDHLREDQIKKPAMNLNDLLPDQRIKMSTLVKHYGLRAEKGLWHETLTIDQADSRYYQAVKERFGSLALVDTPRIEIATIHGVKGGEADNVFFSTSMGRRPYRHYRSGYTRDDEARIFYVAATRAKKGLFIMPSIQNAFPMPAV